MAEQFISYTKHGVAESSLIKATKVGHHYNLVADVPVDNGSFAKIGEFIREDIFEMAIPAIGDKVVLILTAPKIYSTYTTRMQEESNFFNGPQEVARAYEIVDTDRVTLSAECFDESAAPAVGQYVAVTGTGYKLTTVGESDPGATYGFVGKIYDIAANGNYRVWVVRNVQL